MWMAMLMFTGVCLRPEQKRCMMTTRPCLSVSRTWRSNGTTSLGRYPRYSKFSLMNWGIWNMLQICVRTKRISLVRSNHITWNPLRAKTELLVFDLLSVFCPLSSFDNSLHQTVFGLISGCLFHLREGFFEGQLTWKCYKLCLLIVVSIWFLFL